MDISAVSEKIESSENVTSPKSATRLLLPAECGPFLKVYRLFDNFISDLNGQDSEVVHMVMGSDALEVRNICSDTCRKALLWASNIFLKKYLNTKVKSGDTTFVIDPSYHLAADSYAFQLVKEDLDGIQESYPLNSLQIIE